jgi:hypothetical protein
MNETKRDHFRRAKRRQREPRLQRAQAGRRFASESLPPSAIEDQMVDVDGGCPAMDADAAVAGEHLPTDRLPAPTAWATQPATRAAAPRRQPAAAETGLQSHPTSRAESTAALGALSPGAKRVPATASGSIENCRVMARPSPR